MVVNKYVSKVLVEIHMEFCPKDQWKYSMLAQQTEECIEGHLDLDNSDNITGYKILNMELPCIMQ